MTSKRMRFGLYDWAAFFTFGTYAGCSVAVPIALVELAAALDFPLATGGKGLGGALQLGRSLTMVISMLACGFISGRWGKRLTITAAIIAMGGGITLGALSPGYLFLFVALGLAGLGEGIIEGLGTPVVQDLHLNDEPGRYINFTHSFWSIGVVAAVISAGAALAAGISWRWVLATTGLAALIPAALFLIKSKVQSFPVTEHADGRTVRRQIADIVKTPRFWIFFAAMFLAGGGEYCLTFWAAAFIRLDFGGSALAGGIGTAIFSLGMIASRMGGALLISQRGLPRLIIVTAAAGTLLGVLPPFLHSTATFFAVLFLLGVATGPFWPSLQSMAVDDLKTLDSTMIFVLLSCAGVPGCGFFTWLLGAVADTFTMRWSFFLVPLCYCGVGLLTILACRIKASSRV